MTPAIPFQTLLIIGLTILLITGLVLFIRGLIGQRIGTDPHCRKCKYNLTGLQADRCPECGRPASGKNVRIGLRKRRLPALFIGTALLLISLGGIGSAMYSQARNIDWYPHLPAFALVLQAQGHDSRALKEIVTRLGTGKIKGESVMKLVPAALHQQGLHPKPNSIREWTNILAALATGDFLTADQHEQFVDQMAECHVAFLPKIPRGKRICIFLEWVAQGPANPTGNFSVQGDNLQIGDWETRLGGMTSSAHPNGDWNGQIGFWIDTERFEPGVYDVVIEATMAFGHPAMDRKIKESGVLEITPPDTSGVVHLIDDPSLTEQLRQAFSVTPSVSPINGQARLDLKRKKGDLPIDCSFDLIARMGDREQVLWGGLRFPKKYQSNNSNYQLPMDMIDGDYFVPILRTNLSAAESTNVQFKFTGWDRKAMHEIWNGELIFDPIQLDQPDPAADAANTAAPPPATQPAATE